MKSNNKLRNAFGQADDKFIHNVHTTLKKIQKSEEERHIRKNKIAVVFAVAACLTFTTVVVAMTNPWGILDFLSHSRTNVELLPEVKDIVQTNVPQTTAQTELVSFMVRDAVLDGKHAYLTVSAKPANGNIIVIPTLEDPNEYVEKLVKSDSYRRDYEFSATKYAVENNKTLVKAMVTDITDTNGKHIFDTFDFITEEDGTLVCMMSGDIESETSNLELDLECVIKPLDENGKIRKATRSILTCTLKESEVRDIKTSTVVQKYSDCGVQVDKVTLSSTAMAVYVEIEYTVIDKDRFAATNGGLWFEFLDNKGVRIPVGAKGGGSTLAVDGSDTQFVQHSSIQATETLPNTITLCGYNSWDKSRYEVHTLEME